MKLESMGWQMRGLAACAALILGVVVKTANATAEQVLVGVLEEIPGVYSGEASHYGVRVLFRHDANGWQSFPHQCLNSECLASITSKYPRETRWTIWSGGRPLGAVSARTPPDFGFYSDIGVQNVDPGHPVPKVGDRSKAYSGFLETPVQRPLLATSGTRVVDASGYGWKPGAADPADLSRVWPEFRRLVPLIDDCRVDSHGELISPIGRAPHRDELAIASAWADESGHEIIEAQIRNSVFDN